MRGALTPEADGLEAVVAGGGSAGWEACDTADSEVCATGAACAFSSSVILL